MSTPTSPTTDELTEALKALSERLVYFHAEGDRYWFETRPSLNRMAQDRAAAVSREEALMELEERLRAQGAVPPAAPAAPPDEFTA